MNVKKRTMIRRTRLTVWIPLLIAAMVVCLPSSRGAAAAEETIEARELSVTPRFKKQIDRAQHLLAAEKYDDAKKILDDLAARRHANDHERALTWQGLGYLYAAREDYVQAAGAFEKSLSFNALPKNTEMSVRYNLAQVFLMLKRHDVAVRMLEIWFAATEVPSPEAYYLLAIAYVQNNQSAMALLAARQAVAAVERPKESWLQLVLSICLEQGDYAAAVPLLERLIAEHDKKAYWLQLSAVHAQLGQEREALAIMELAYERGLLTEDKELRTLAQLYVHQEIPYRAAQVIERGLSEGTITSDAEAWRLLAESWLYTKEYQRAEEPLQRAAQLAESGEMYMRLAQLYVEQERWSEAQNAVTAALSKGRLENPGSALLIFGIVNFNTNRLDEARRAFEEAADIDASRVVATRWLEYIERQGSNV